MTATATQMRSAVAVTPSARTAHGRHLAARRRHLSAQRRAVPILTRLPRSRPPSARARTGPRRSSTTTASTAALTLSPMVAAPPGAKGPGPASGAPADAPDASAAPAVSDAVGAVVESSRGGSPTAAKTAGSDPHHSSKRGKPSTHKGQACPPVAGTSTVTESVPWAAASSRFAVPPAS